MISFDRVCESVTDMQTDTILVYLCLHGHAFAQKKQQCSYTDFVMVPKETLSAVKYLNCVIAHYYSDRADTFSSSPIV